jgi:Ca-activated chloride channel family protein
MQSTFAETRPVPGQAQDQTLSPYFFVKSDDPAVDALPLKHTGAEVSIAGVIADVRVTQVYKNAGKRPLEAIYVFPASTRAAVYALKMTIGERTIVAKIDKREQARQQYEQAKAEGKSASLLEQQRPNVFQMNVANILPGDEIKVELAYTELLVPTSGIYSFVYPTVVGPRYSREAAAEPSERWVQNPYLRETEAAPYPFDLSVRLAAGVPLQEVASSSHQVEVSYQGKNDAEIRLAPAEKQGGDRDFILQYRLAGGQVVSGLLLYPGAGENFFLLMAQPPKRVAKDQIPPREYIFVVDISGSMHGFPLEISKSLLRDLVGNLRSADRFNVVLFAGGFATLAEESVPATTDNIRRALELIDRQGGGGGTEILPALRHALALPRPPGFSRSLVVATDGYVDVEPEVFDLIRGNLDTANLFAFGIGTSVNRHLIEGMAHVGMGEPFVVSRPEDAAQQAVQFRQYVETPVLTQVRVDFGDLEVYDVEPPAIPDVLAERPVIVVGKWRGAPRGTITVHGRMGEGPYRATLDVGAVTPAESNRGLKYLWARRRIALLGDYHNLRPDSETVQQITDLGLKYGLLTQYTSFVAIDTMVRSKDGRPETVKQPLPLPLGVSDLAVGEQATSARSRGVTGGGVLGVLPSAPAMAPDATTAPLFARGTPQAESAGPFPSVSVQAIEVSGASDRRAVEQAIRARTHDLEWCVNAARGKEASRSGAIQVRIVFHRDGTVKEVLPGDSGQPQGLEECLKKRLTTWTIPAFATGGKPVEVTLRVRVKG